MISLLTLKLIIEPDLFCVIPIFCLMFDSCARILQAGVDKGTSGVSSSYLCSDLCTSVCLGKHTLCVRLTISLCNGPDIISCEKTHFGHSWLWKSSWVRETWLLEGFSKFNTTGKCHIFNSKSLLPLDGVNCCIWGHLGRIMVTQDLEIRGLMKLHFVELKVLVKHFYWKRK